MLIYNYKKEFLGIDEKDLKILGFNDLEELRREITDFADLFVKTPGYIHNFQHVHWIDFITCGESSEESKVIINVKARNYRATLNIASAYLLDSPSSKAYFINLNNLKELSNKDVENISTDIANKPVVIPTQAPAKTFTAPKEEVRSPIAPSVTHDPYESPLDLDMDFDEEPKKEVKPKTTEAPKEIKKSDHILDIGDLSLDVDFEEELPKAPAKTSVKTKESFNNGYVYDPKVASEELGLPIDLIEEFIQDFIAQSHEFKDGLYKSFSEGNLDNLKVLSHKLKGVAANLRIEDALETLTIINSSADINVLQENLDTFYKIIAKLAGETVEVENVTVAVADNQEVAIDEDDFKLDFKETEKSAPLALDIEDDLYSDPIDLDEPLTLSIDEDSEESLDLLEMKDEDKIEISESEKPQETKKGYSKKSIANEIGLDSNSFAELFEDYMNESTSITKDIKNFIENDDLASCKREAFKLKGMSEHMRIDSFTSELETLIKASDKDQMIDAITKIDAELAHISTVEV